MSPSFGFPVLPADPKPLPAQPIVTNAPLRYVILHHLGIPIPHFDLMFETGPGCALATWRSADWPVDSPAIVERLADHRRDYLDYEGPVGDDRGHVSRVIGGTCWLRAASLDFVMFETEHEHRFTFKRQAGTSLWQMEVGQSD
jgi:hypothetical protein